MLHTQAIDKYRRRKPQKCRGLEAMRTCSRTPTIPYTGNGRTRNALTHLVHTNKVKQTTEICTFLRKLNFYKFSNSGLSHSTRNYPGKLRRKRRNLLSDCDRPLSSVCLGQSQEVRRLTIGRNGPFLVNRFMDLREFAVFTGFYFSANKPEVT